MKRDKVLAAGGTASVLGAAVALAFVLGSGSDTPGGTHGKGSQSVRTGAANGAPVNAALTAACKHNPPKNTKLELKVDPNKVAPADQVTFTGTMLGEGDKNCPATGRTVELFIAGKGGNPDSSIGTTNTDSNGAFSFNYNPVATNDYIARWTGDVTYPPDTSNKVHVDVKP